MRLTPIGFIAQVKPQGIVTIPPTRTGKSSSYASHASEFYMLDNAVDTSTLIVFNAVFGGNRHHWKYNFGRRPR